MLLRFQLRRQVKTDSLSGRNSHCLGKGLCDKDVVEAAEYILYIRIYHQWNSEYILYCMVVFTPATPSLEECPQRCSCISSSTSENIKSSVNVQARNE